MELTSKIEKSFWENLRSGEFARMVKEASKGQALKNPHEVYHVTKPLFAEKDDVERLYGIFLDGQNRVLSIDLLFTGSIASSVVYPREIAKHLIGLKAAAVALVHNHPSGETKPSREDQVMTRKVALALESIDVKLLDHIIVGDGYHSMSESGFLKTVFDELQVFLKGHKS